MAKHSADRFVTGSEHNAMIALAWHDVTCPEGPDCLDRSLHAAGQQLASTGMLGRFLDRLSEIETEGALDDQLQPL
jgi:hypothetical protein